MNAAIEEFDCREFRSALGQFATGVTVVTAASGDDEYVGTTASSFNSVSIDPPLILWSIDKGALGLPVYEKAEHFVVNVLAADQVTLSNHFARQQKDKFAGVDYRLNDQGVPVLKGCSAYFLCKIRYLYEGGDHTIIVGEVIQFDSQHRKALLFHQGCYSVSEAHPVVNQPGIAEPKKESFAANYLHYLAGRCFTQLMKHLDAMLETQGVTQFEYRVLASFSGLSGANFETLEYYTLLQREDLSQVINGLIKKGMVARNNEMFTLTNTGQKKLMPLMAIAKSNEADMLGAFSGEQAQEFKQMLKRAIDWTA